MAQAYGSYALNTSLLTTCNDSAASVTVSFNDPKELYGNSLARVTMILAPTCSVSSSQHVLQPFSYMCTASLGYDGLILCCAVLTCEKRHKEDWSTRVITVGDFAD